MNRELEKVPGAAWNFSQPIEDNVGETVTGTKGQLALKIYGNDLKTIEQKGEEVIAIMQRVRGIKDVKLYRVIGQPNLNFTVDRRQAARFGINVTDVQDAIETAVGGKAVTQVLQGEQRYDVVVRYQEPYRSTGESHRQHPPAFPFRENASRWRNSPRWMSATAPTTSTAKA